MNIIIFLIEIIITIFLITVIYKKYKYEGLEVLLIIYTILLPIISLKEVSLLAYPIPLALVPNTAIFIIINIILQTKGKSKAIQELWLIWLVSLFSFILLSLTSYLPSYITPSFPQIIGSNLRMYTSIVLALLLSLLINIKLYYFLRRIKNKIWVSNIVSGIIIQFIYSIIFTLLYGVFRLPINTMVGIVVIMSSIKILINTIGTIPVYITNNMKER